MERLILTTNPDGLNDLANGESQSRYFQNSPNDPNEDWCENVPASFDLEESSETNSQLEPFYEILRQYERSIDDKAPLTPEQLKERFPEYKGRIDEYFRRRRSLQFLKGDKRIELCDTERYKHIRPRNRGGMGAVFLAHDCHFDRQTILKVPLALNECDERAARRMERESLLSGHLQHPNILPIFEKGKILTTDGRSLPFFAMRFLDGESLQQMLDGRKSLNQDNMLYILLFQQVCRAMAYAHSQMVANLDLKPANVMVGKFNDAYVIDWGLAIQMANRPSQLPQAVDQGSKVTGGVGKVESASENSGCKTGANGFMQGSVESTVPHFDIRKELSSIGGTRHYSPPELMNPSIDIENLDFERIDVFCLGGILCRIITGAATYPNPDIADLPAALKRIEQSSASKELKRIALDCLAERPEDRPSDANEVEQRINSYVLSQEQAKLRSEKQLRNLVILISVILISIAIWIAYATNQRTKSASQQAFYNSGLRSIAAGNLPEAEKQFAEGIKIGNPPLTFYIKQLRTSLVRNTRERSLVEAQRLLNLAESEQDNAELRLVIGDLKACDTRLKSEFQQDVKAALALNQLSLADAQYARALLAESISDCLEHLESALSNERFHHRAASFYCAVLLANGRMKDAEDKAGFYLTVFAEDVPLQAVAESCQALKDSTHATKSFSENFDKKLAALRRGFLPPVGTTDEEPTDQFAFTRQGVVALNAASFIRELPKVSNSPGLPQGVFDSRAKFWRELSSIANKLGAPQNILQWSNSVLVSRDQLLRRLESLSEHEQDRMFLHVLGIGKLSVLAPNYKAWFKNDPERLNAMLIEIDDTLSKNPERETIAPRGQFELALRIVRFLVNIQLSKVSEERSTVAQEKLQEDLDRLHSLILQYPQMLSIACGLITESFLAAIENYPATQMDFANQLRFVNLWTSNRPQVAKAWLASARVWQSIDKVEEAKVDLAKCLKIDPKLKEAVQLLEQLNGHDKPTVESPKD